MALLTGIGRPVFTSTDLTENFAFPIGVMEFSIEGASNKAVSKKYVDGFLATAGSAITEKTYTMKIGIEAINWYSLQFAIGELAQVTASASLAEVRYGTVASGEIADADITAATVLATLETGNSTVAPGVCPVVAGTPTAGSREVKIDTTNHKLVFDTALNGSIVSYRIFDTFTNLETIGVEATADVLSNFKFEGVLHMDESSSSRVKIVIPQLTRSGEPSISIATPTKLEVGFDLVSPTGARRPFYLYNLDSAA